MALNGLRIGLQFVLEDYSPILFCPREKPCGTDVGQHPCGAPICSEHFEARRSTIDVLVVHEAHGDHRFWSVGK
jgi:hypothetical protein